MTEPNTKVGSVFIGLCLNAIDMMRKARMDEALIACVLMEIRMAAIQEDRMYRMRLEQQNPPPSPRPSDILRYLSELSG